MCKFKSMIILKDRVFIPDYDSHERMLGELGIEDSLINAQKVFARAELSPMSDEEIFGDISKWKFKVDQDILPDWFDEDEAKDRAIEAVSGWAKTHIIDGGKSEELQDGIYYVHNSTVTACDDSTVEAYGNSRVEAYGNSRVTAYDNSRVEAYGNSTVRAYDNSRVEAYDNSRVTACDDSTVEAYDNSRVTAYDDSTVRAYDNSRVEAYGNSRVTSGKDGWNWANKGSISLSGNAIYTDYVDKRIYVTSTWTIERVSAEDEADGTAE